MAFMPGVAALLDCGVPVHDARSGICGKGERQSLPLFFLLSGSKPLAFFSLAHTPRGGGGGRGGDRVKT